MSDPSGYSPPPSASMISRQRDPTGLRLLVAQRKLYSKAKRWLGIRWIGMAAMSKLGTAVGRAKKALDYSNAGYESLAIDQLKLMFNR
ncbi:S-4TM family putative pore-forming effector [Microbacterium hatanonis]|uniref:Uncharacterized protein n=1 Tax=Microbacterium hatanonis TaxID=404366 RepID=A0A5C8HXQ7_9MICO|nr:S-4TM family putative pore-forming effector [Microbacterium hatanonis]TXK09746.1 hypothetical protein FVP77_12680 [Microbacterium hatanonis]